MSDNLHLVVATFAGLLLGVFFYGGLWWTVRKALTSGQPGIWFFASLLCRTGVSLFGFYIVCGVSWERWLVSLAMFTLARFAVLRITQGLSIKQVQIAKIERELRHATQP